MSKLTGSLPPFTDRRRCLPPLFPQTFLLPADVKSRVDTIAYLDGDDPSDVLADLLLLAADELEGAVMDERELGFSTDPWPQQLAPGKEGAPGPEGGNRAPPAGFALDGSATVNVGALTGEP